MNAMTRMAFLLYGCCTFSPVTQAAITCTLSSPGFMSVYDSTIATPNDSTSSVTVDCTRALTDPATATYALRANYGINGGRATNRKAKQTAGARTVNYNEYQDPAFATVWGNTNRSALSVPINFGTGTTFTTYIPFYARIPALQAIPAATYADTITMTLRNGRTTVASATHPVTISTLAQCQISTPPGNIIFTYTSFQATAATSNTTFATRCTSALPYTMGLDPDSPLLGLAYTLSLPVTAASGNGMPQTYSINGTIAGGQSGLCSMATCTGSATRTLTVTF